MEEIHKDIKEIKHSMIKVENDLKYHIKRTDLLESFMKNQIKFLLAVLIAIFAAFVGKAYAGQPHIDFALAKIKKEVPCKVIVTSGWRSKHHNWKIGGAKNSYHLYDRARDIQAKCLTTSQLGKICKKHANGVIVYKNHVHIDNRGKPYYGKGEY